MIHRPLISQNTENTKIMPGRKTLVIAEFIHCDIFSTWATNKTL